jgi:hypothetical protein
MYTALESVNPMKINLNLNLNLNNKLAVNQTLIVTLDISAPKNHVMPPFLELALKVIAKWLAPENMNLFVAAMVKPIVTAVKQPDILSM